MARTPFTAPEARIVVCSDGYFDVFPPTGMKTGAKPAYRGVIAELGNTVSAGGLLTVRPDSPRLAAAVMAWSAARGAAAVRGELGRGRG
jgi:hypothetical protein